MSPHVEGQAQRQIFIDYLRNQRGSTAIAPFSTRSRPGAHIALPVSWQGLGRLTMRIRPTLRPLSRWSRRRRDPWAGYHKIRQALPKMS